MVKIDKNILVVEDDADLCNSILSALVHGGFAPTGVTSLREATFKLKNQKYSCVLLDMNLGDDDGAELITLMRTRNDIPNGTTPIIVISGHLDKERVQSIARQIQGALVKPFEIKTLLELVGRISE